MANNLTEFEQCKANNLIQIIYFSIVMSKVSEKIKKQLYYSEHCR